MSSKKEHRPRSISTSGKNITGFLPGQPPGMDFIIEPYESPTSKTQKFRITYIRKSSSTEAQSPQPPPSPCPWLWRCHSCYTIYRLSVTRRCLDCDHTFCLGEPATGSTAPKGSKKRKRGGPCKAEFDYKGWKTWGSWRRTQLLNDNVGDDNDIITNNNEKKSSSWGDEYEAANAGPDSEMTPFEEKREHLFLRKRHNCFLHCDFPSECHHALFRAQQEGRPILREALALDAAAEEAERKGKKFSKRITVSEYKQRQRTGARFVEDLPRVDEADEEDNVSPCSPTSPDPPGDLMREVSPIEREGEQSNDDDGVPLSPRRRSLLVATDTPADFATTAAPFSFDDENIYSNDGDDEHEHGEEEEEEEEEEEKRRTKSRRKIAQLTGHDGGLESFGPFRFDTSAPSPTSPESTAGYNHQHHHNPTTLDLQAAYSEQAWFSSSSNNTGSEQQPLSPKSPERMGKRDRMLALLGRRGPPSPSSPTRSSSPGNFSVPARHNNYSQQRRHGDATATGREGYGSSSDSSPASSSASTTTTTSSYSAGSGLVTMDEDEDDDTDADGDVPMRDVDEDMEEDYPVTPTSTGKRHGAGARGDDDGEEDLRALLRMRNAFMRGEMI